MPYSLDDIRGFRNRVEAQNTPQGTPQPALATDALYDQSKPVQARELFTVQPPPAQPQQQDSDESLFEMSAPAPQPEFEGAYEPDKRQFYDAFARGFNTRRFTGLKDYENWLKTLPGAGTMTLSYVQEIGEKYMPTAAKQEWEAKQQDKMMRQKIVSQVGLEKIMKEERKRQGLESTTPAEQKTLDTRLKNAIALREKAGSAKEREFFQNQIDTLMSGGDSAPQEAPTAKTITREAFIQGFTAKKGYAPTEAMIQNMVSRGIVK